MNTSEACFVFLQNEELHKYSTKWSLSFFTIHQAQIAASAKVYGTEVYICYPYSISSPKKVPHVPESLFSTMTLHFSQEKSSASQ